MCVCDLENCTLYGIMFPVATVRSSSPLDRGSEAEDPPALPLLGKSAHFAECYLLTCVHVRILIVIIIHVCADSPKVPAEPKTGRKLPAAVSKAQASVKAAGTYAGFLINVCAWSNNYC